MDSIDLIKANRLTEARDQLLDEVEHSPGDSGKRVLLFQVLSFCADYEQAENQLNQLASRDPRWQNAAIVYKGLLCAEKERAKVAAGERCPALLSPAPPYLEEHLLARQKLQGGKARQLTGFFREVEDETHAFCGTANGKLFQGFKDGDALLAPFLELFIHDRYLWLTFDDLKELFVSAPNTMLDLLWAPAQLTTWQGITTSCYLPVLYPGSSTHVDEMVRMGKMTHWRAIGGGLVQGAGQHIFKAGTEELALLEVRELRFMHDAR